MFLPGHWVTKSITHGKINTRSNMDCKLPSHSGKFSAWCGRWTARWGTMTQKPIRQVSILLSDTLGVEYYISLCLTDLLNCTSVQLGVITMYPESSVWVVAVGGIMPRTESLPMMHHYSRQIINKRIQLQACSRFSTAIWFHV